MDSSLLELRGVGCGYDGKSVLTGINLTVEPGETVALLGPNGSGKSTLLKAICKGVALQSGELTLEGREISKMSHREVARIVAFVPQEESFKFDFLVREVVTMGRLPISDSLWDTREDVEAATEAMREADCLHLEGRSVMELSGGEKQRVLIARALAQGSQVMLFDEPTSHLDVEHQIAVSELIKRLSVQGRAIVTAIHDLNLAPLIADRAVLLKDGQIGLDAPMTEALESAMLDQVYNVRFIRSQLENGRMVVLPEANFLG